MPPTKNNNKEEKAKKANPHDAKKKTTTPVVTPQKPWEYQVILREIFNNRDDKTMPNHYSASDLFKLYRTVLHYWVTHINSAIVAIHDLHGHIQTLLENPIPLALTSAHPENSNSYVEYITLTLSILHIAQRNEKYANIEEEVKLINNFLNNIDVYIRSDIKIPQSSRSGSDLTKIKDEIDRKHLQHIRNYELVSDEKTKLENLEWIMDGPDNHPKRIQSYGKFEDGSYYITMGIVENGLVRDYEHIALPDDTPVFTMYAENPDNEVTDYDSDDSDDEQDGGKKRRIQRTPTNKRNTKKKNTKRKHANNGGADPPSPSVLPGSPVEQVANTNNPQHQQQQLQQLQQQIHGLYAQIQELHHQQQQQQQQPPPEEASNSPTPGGKPKAKMSKTKKRRCKKSSKTKKRNMKRYHNANTKTNRKKRVP